MTSRCCRGPGTGSPWATPWARSRRSPPPSPRRSTRTGSPATSTRSSTPAADSGTSVRRSTQRLPAGGRLRNRRSGPGVGGAHGPEEGAVEVEAVDQRRGQAVVLDPAGDHGGQGLEFVLRLAHDDRVADPFDHLEVVEAVAGADRVLAVHAEFGGHELEADGLRGPVGGDVEPVAPSHRIADFVESEPVDGGGELLG